MKFAPEWVKKKEIMSEHDENWDDASESVTYSNVPQNSNVISSHYF